MGRYKDASDNHYANIHKWLSRNYGKAYHCENPSCENKSSFFHWSLLKGKTYEKRRENFRQLCVSCHGKYDYTEHKRQATKNRIITDELRKKMADLSRGKKASKETRKKLSIRFSGEGNNMFGVSITGPDHHFYGKNHTVETKLKLLQQRAKVTKEQIQSIQIEKESGISQRDIARKYGISTASVCRIVNKKRYKLWQ